VTRQRIGRPSAAEPLCGLTYERVAELLGEVTPQTSRQARRWLRGQSDMGVGRLVRLADASGVPLEDLARELVSRQ
jgi:transcriptional regulator with XRE-family HTH domain